MTALLLAFVRRDFATTRSYGLPFLLGLFETVGGIALFYFLGQLIGDATAVTGALGDVEYFSFALVGLATLEMLNVSLTSFSLRLRNDQTTGTFEALLATPASPAAVIVGTGTYDLIRATFSGMLVVLIAVVLFGFRPELTLQTAVAALAALAALTMVFAALGIALAAFTVVFKQTTALLALVSTGVALFAGIYFPREILPAPLEAVADALPIAWGLDVLRGALLEGEVLEGRLALTAGVAAVAIVLSLILFTAAIRHAKRRGTLGHY